MTTVDTVEPIAQLDVTIDEQFRAWIDPRSNLQPPLLIVGAGLSSGLVPRANELATAICARQGEIEDELQIAAGPAIAPECESDLYAWAGHCIDELTAKHSHSDKRTTVLDRLALNMLGNKVPRASDNVGEWLATLGRIKGDLKAQADGAALRWMRLDSEAGRKDVAAKIATDRGLASNVRDVLLQWLKDRSAVLESIDGMVKMAGTALEAVNQDWPRIQADVEIWATWLTGQRPNPTRETMQFAPQAIVESTEPSDDVLTAELRTLTKSGQLLRARLEHFDLLTGQFLSMWQESHPDRCPTCDQSHPQEGIAGVVTRIRQSVDDELHRSRERYATVQAEMKRRQALRAGTGKPPIGSERQEQMARLLCLPPEGADSLAQRLMLNPGDWRSVLSPMQTLLGGIALPQSADAASAEADVEAMVRQLVTADEQSERMREAPERWQQLKKRVDDVAREVVGGHLPGTLEAVWREIALAMAPGRWNQVADYCMKLDQQRGTTRLGIVTQRPGIPGVSIPILHVLNQAEQHVLGLAWFFTRHLSNGRFLTPLIALDDPAQEMDQVTFRRFVRFSQSFVRAHRRAAKPLQLVVMLHQEDRALELARAISKDGEVTMLSWAREMRASGVDPTVGSLKLRNSEQRAPLPQPLRPQVQSQVGAGT